MSSDDDDDAELIELKQLKKKQDLYGWDDDNKEYKKRLKDIAMKYSGKAKAKPLADADESKKKWCDWAYPTVHLKVASFALAAEKVEGDLKTDNPRGGVTNLAGVKGLAWRRRIAIVDGEEVKYRIIEVDPGKKYQLQKLTAVEEVDEDDSEPPMAASEVDKKSGKAAQAVVSVKKEKPAPASKKGGKKREEPEEEEEEPSPRRTSRSTKPKQR